MHRTGCNIYSVSKICNSTGVYASTLTKISRIQLAVSNIANVYSCCSETPVNISCHSKVKALNGAEEIIPCRLFCFITRKLNRRIVLSHSSLQWAGESAAQSWGKKISLVQLQVINELTPLARLLPSLQIAKAREGAKLLLEGLEGGEGKGNYLANFLARPCLSE